MAPPNLQDLIKTDDTINLAFYGMVLKKLEINVIKFHFNFGPSDL
jgi:hypothetical protein